MLNSNNPISRSPFKIPFARLLVLKIYSISYLEGEWCSIHGFLCCFETIFMQCLLGNGLHESVSIPESGSPKNHCIGSNSWWTGKFGSLSYTKKNGISAVAKLGVTL